MDGLFEPMSFDGRRDATRAHDSLSSYLSFSSFASISNLQDDPYILGHAGSSKHSGNNNISDSYNTFTSPTSQSTCSFVDTAYADDPFIINSDPFEIVNAGFQVDLDLADFDLTSIGGAGDWSDFGSDIGSGGAFANPTIPCFAAQAGPSKYCSSNRAPLDYTLGPAAATATLGSFSSSISSPPRPSTSEYDSSPLVTPASRDRVEFSSTSPDFQHAGFSWDNAPFSLGSSSSTPYRRTTNPVVSQSTNPTYAANPAPLRVVSTPSLTAATPRKAVKPVMSMPSLKEEDVCFEWLNIPDGSEQVAHPATSNQDFEWVFGGMGMDQASLDGTIFAAFKEGETANDSWSDLASMANLPAQTPKMPPAAPVTVPPSASSSASANVPKAEVPAMIESVTTETNVYMAESASAPSGMSFMADTPAPMTDFVDPFAFTSSVADIRPATAPEESFDLYGMSSAPGPMVRSHTAPGLPHRAAPSDIFYQPPSTVPASSSFEVDISAFGSIPPPLSTSSSASAPNSGLIPQTHRSFSGRRPHPQLTVNVDSPSFSAPTSFDGTAPGTYPLTPQSAIYPSHSSVSNSLAAPVPMTRAGSQPLPVRRASSSSITTGPSNGAPTTATRDGRPPLPAHMVRAAAMVQAAEAREEERRQEYRRQVAARRLPMEQASVMQPPTPTRPAVLGWDGSQQQQQQQQQTQYVQPNPHYVPPAPLPLQQPQQPMLYQPPQQQQQQQPQYVQPTVVMSHTPAPMVQQQQQQPPHYQQTYVHPPPAHQMQIQSLPQPPAHVQHPPVPSASSAGAAPPAYGYQSQAPKALVPPHASGEYNPHSRSHSNPNPISHPPPHGATHAVSQPVLTTQPLVVHPPVSGGFTYTAPPPHRIHPPLPSAGLPMTATATGTGPSTQSAPGSGTFAHAVPNRPMARLPSPRSRKTSSPSKSANGRSPSGRKRTQTVPGGFSWGEATFINFTSDDAEKLLTGVAPSGSQNKRKREEEQARLAMQQGQLGIGQSQQNQQMQLQAQMQGQVPIMNIHAGGEEQGGKRIRTE